MKTNEQIEKDRDNLEIGELIAEITEKGFLHLEMDIDDSEPSGRVVYVAVESPEKFFSISHDSITEALAHIVDSIRHYRGEPSLAEEVEKMLQEQADHEKITPIVCGTHAQCVCGSVKDLHVSRTVNFRVDWWTGSITASDLGQYPKPGELGCCPDCGKWYQLRA